jgi:diguanylate cyclase (GGDEF)-like protein/PAS domain S-box-containing protein
MNLRYQNDQAMAVSLKLSALRAHIEKEITQNLLLVYGTANFISVNPKLSQAQFQQYAKGVMAGQNLLKNLGAAPDFVIKYIYPLEGNRQMLGVDYRQLEDQWELVRQVQETGDMVVAGPLQLVQGGWGLIGRAPVVLRTAGSPGFWGVVSAVIDVDRLFANVGIDRPGDLDIAIRGTDGTGGRGDVFLGDLTLFDPSKKAVRMAVTFPSGSWQMAARPKRGWTAWHPFSWVMHGLMALFFLTVVFFVFRSLQDIAERKRVALALKKEERKMRAMLEASYDAYVMIDDEETILFWSPAAEKMFGWTNEEAMGQKVHSLIAPSRYHEDAARGIEQFARTGQGSLLNLVLELEACRKNGDCFPVEMTVAAFRNDGRYYAVSSVRDITARKKAQKELEKMATTDSLTGLANRGHFMTLAAAEIQRTLRYSRPLSILMIDADRFKNINDIHGHDIGDKVLQALGATLASVLRSTDTAGRIGGEEFALMLPETALPAAMALAERLRQTVEQKSIPMSGGPPVSFTVSIGVAALTDPSQGVDDLLKRADQALYQAKSSGRNRVAS